MTGRRCKPILLAAFLLAAFIGAFAGAAMAQSQQSQQSQEPQPPRADTGRPGGNLPVAAQIPADAPNARLAALIRRDVRVVRNKGVASVTRVSKGVYCILPTASTGIVPSTAIVTLTPEYFYSGLNEIKVQWASAGSNCASNTIAVYTLADPSRTGLYGFSNAVSFSIVVP